MGKKHESDARMAKVEGLRGFRTLKPSDRKAVADATREVRVAKGQFIFRQGERAESLWAVKEGVVHIVKSGADTATSFWKSFPR